MSVSLAYIKYDRDLRFCLTVVAVTRISLEITFSNSVSQYLSRVTKNALKQTFFVTICVLLCVGDTNSFVLQFIPSAFGL